MATKTCGNMKSAYDLVIRGKSHKIVCTLQLKILNNIYIIKFWGRIDQK